MINLSFDAKLTGTQKKTETGTSESIRFVIPSAKTEELDLKKGDLVQIHICKIFRQPDYIEAETVDIPMPGRIIVAGSQSLGITIRYDIRERYGLKSGYGIRIDNIVITKKSRRS